MQAEMTRPADKAGFSLEAEMFEIESWCDLVAAAPPPLAAATGLKIVRAGGAVCVVAPGIPSTEFNRAVGLGIARPASDDDLDAVLDVYSSRGVARAAIQLVEGAAQPANLHDWLAAKGAPDLGGRWVVCESIMPPAHNLDSVVRIDEIGGSEADEAGRVFCAGYGLPPVFAPWTAGLVGRPNWRSYAAFDGQRMIGVGFLYRIGPRAAMLGAATLPDARRRGAQTGLLARRLRDGFADGAQIVQSHTWMPGPDALNPSLDNMLRAGLSEVHKRVNHLLQTQK